MASKSKMFQTRPNAIKNIIKNVQTMEIAVGLPKGGNSTGTAYPDGTPVLAVGFWNEFGTRGIPERPFIRPGGRNAYKELKGELTAVVKYVNRGGNLEEALNKIGAEAAMIIQKYMDELKEPPNSPMTIARKGSDNPLIDTRLLQRSIMWQVRKKKGLDK